MIRFIAIDPSSTETGWAVFENDSLIAWGTIDTKKQIYVRRFNFIIEELERLALDYLINSVAIEETGFAWGHARQRNIAGLQVVFKAIKEWAKSHKFTTNVYNVATWKNSIVGHVHATKEQTKNNVMMRIDSLPDNLNEHEYDAIAIGLYHAGYIEQKGEGQ
jgi:Holliday junction resolvasome RuvABC endonuclease subunit